MSCATGMVWSLYEPQKQGGISMILEELKKIKSFGSDRESYVTPEDIADKERELGFTLPQALQEFYLTFHENDPVFSAKNRFIPLRELERTERHLVGSQNVEVITFYTYGIWGVGFRKETSGQDIYDPYTYTYYNNPKNQKQKQASICRSGYRLSSSMLGWVSAQQLFSQNSIGRIDPKELAYNDQEAVCKIFNMLPIGQAENNIGRACSTKNPDLYGFIDFGLRCVFVSADSSSQVTDFMENIHVGFQWYKLDGKLIEKTHGTQKPIKKRALLDIEPAIETLNHFINVIDPQSLEQEIAEVGQRLGAVIPEPLKKLYLCIPRKYLDAPNCFVLPECLKNEDGKIRFLSGSQGVFDYAFEHLSPIVYRSEMDGLWSEYGVIDGFVVTQLFWNIMNREDLVIVLAEIPQCTKQSLSAKGALGKNLIPCFQKLTMENMQQLYHSPENNIIAVYDKRLKTLYVAAHGEEPLKNLEEETKMGLSWLT